MIYTDGIHLIGDDLKELHGFAKNLGLGRHWFHSGSSYPHYDLYISERPRKIALELALKRGAVKKTSKELVEILQNKKVKKKNGRKYNNK